MASSERACLWHTQAVVMRRHAPHRSTQEAEALALLLDQAPGGGFYPSASLQGNCDLDAEPGAALPLHVRAVAPGCVGCCASSE
jgi:hypothetical protein